MDENAKRVLRKAERAIRARDGGNHSRVWSKTSGPFAGWRDRAKHDIGDQSELDQILRGFDFGFFSFPFSFLKILEMKLQSIREFLVLTLNENLSFVVMN